MARPKKWRKVCSLPDNSRFGPLDSPADASHVNMTVDEYEAIRLIDLEGFTQEECAQQMNIARSTVQGIYGEARKKLAESLVIGKILHIEGGEYQLCDGSRMECGRGCHRRRRGRHRNQNGGFYENSHSHE
ncbi:MAG TPA: DUF134 domain-containing protein [Anaerolineaceae bacterium]|jgi:predicted DNA-binding protein (UPF0251 family)|nr:DUF134 domain-containing protein [Chloroflexota bacterium]HPL81141.1 DUF134 domain-containing protein [Anaerolineaceae bacterium]